MASFCRLRRVVFLGVLSLISPLQFYYYIFAQLPCVLSCCSPFSTIIKCESLNVFDGGTLKASRGGWWLEFSVFETFL